MPEYIDAQELGNNRRVELWDGGFVRLVQSAAAGGVMPECETDLDAAAVLVLPLPLIPSTATLLPTKASVSSDRSGPATFKLIFSILHPVDVCCQIAVEGDGEDYWLFADSGGRYLLSECMKARYRQEHRRRSGVEGISCICSSLSIRLMRQNAGFLHTVWLLSTQETSHLLDSLCVSREVRKWFL